LSNWTELDVWMYIRRENIKIPNLYFSHDRAVFKRDGMWLAWAPFMAMRENEKLETRTVRCRTIGDMTCTGVVLSEANTMDEIVAEVAASRQTERGNRADDKRSESAMEDRKKEGYF